MQATEGNRNEPVEEIKSFTNLKNPLHLHRHRKGWSFECWFAGLVGLALVCLYMQELLPRLTVVQETIALVIFLGGIMGITRIPFPSKFSGKPIPLYVYPLISGFISGFMDSFLVLLLVGAARLEGTESEKLKFRALNMIAALIGGLITYFGEVYMLPLALLYGQREWYAMLPIVPPVAVFLCLLALLASRLNLSISGMKEVEQTGSGHHKKVMADAGDYIEFAFAIGLLLITHDALFCLGVLLAYSFITGQGEDLIDVVKTETEVGVMLLLVFAAFVAGPIEPYIAQWSGWWAFFPSAINGVLMGAIYPASGDMWFDAHILSTAVLITPISSLVGIILFKTWREWMFYMKYSIPLAAAWFLIAGLWFWGPWKTIQPYFEAQFGRPQIVARGQ